MYVLIRCVFEADISPLVEKWDDSNMTQDDGVMEVVRQLDKACREAGFFYVVIFLVFLFILDCLTTSNTISLICSVALINFQIVHSS